MTTIESQMQVRSGQLVREERRGTARRCSSYWWKEAKVAAVDSLLDIPPISLTQLRMGIRIFGFSLFFLSPCQRGVWVLGIFSTKRPRFRLWLSVGRDGDGFVMWV